MFLHESGRVMVEWYPKIASTVIANGYLMYPDLSGAIQPADATSGNHMGVAQKDVAATDDDYAENTYIPVLVPTDETVWRVDVGTGTLTTAMIGGFYDLANAYSIDVSAQAKNVVQGVGFVSSSVALVKVNAMAANANVATS